MEMIVGPLRSIILCSLGVTAVVCFSLYFFKPVEGVMLFLCTCVLLKIRESVEYKRHKFDQTEVRYCTVTCFTSQNR